MRNFFTLAFRLFCRTGFYYFLFVSCCLFVSSLHAQSQWQWLNPKPSGTANKKVVFVNSTTGYILNNNSILYKTTDAGSSWQQAQTFGSALCMNIKDSTGIIAGYYGTVYLSTDNGVSWTRININATDQINNINIVGRDTIILSSPYNNLYKSVNRGKSWTALHCNTYITAISFASSSIGYIGSQGSAIYKTEDGGSTWTLKLSTNSFPSTILSMQFLDKDTGYAFREFNDLLKTTDGGTTWTSIDAHETIAAMDFINTTDGYFGGENGAMYATHDGGQTFEWIGFGGLIYGNDINSVDFLSRDTGYAVGLLGRIIKTTDAGKSWVPYSPLYTPVSAVSFGSATTGIATSGKYIYKTTDKGQTWDTLKTLTARMVYADYSSFDRAYFSSADTGMIVESIWNKVFTTTDGGTTWDSVKMINYNDYYPTDMQFLTKTTGFIALHSSASSGSTIVKTKDGGHSWDTVWNAKYMGERFDHIYYLNEDTGYASSLHDLYKTTDGSKTWTVVYKSDGYSNITGISFSSFNKGLFTNDDGNIISTTDGGATWTTTGLPNYYSWGVSALKFYNGQLGYLIAGNDVYKTIDSGATWTIENHIGGTSISFTPDTSVVIAGYGGAITTSHITGLSVLPVHLVDIRATYTKQGNLITWETTNETNSREFVIESSTDCNRFQSIGKQDAKGNSTVQTAYSFRDVGTAYSNAQRMYYRIRMVDINGTFTYTKVVVVDMPTPLLHLVISPNPASGETVLYLNQPAAKAVFSVFDAQGKRILTGQFTADNQQYHLTTAQLRTGMYTVYVESDGDRYTGRFMVVK